MDKTSFEKLISRRAENIYQDKKREFAALISKFIDRNFIMNGHDSGNSTSYELQLATNAIFEKKKPSIISLIEKDEIEKVMSNLNEVKFLFDHTQKAGEINEGE